MHLGVVHPRLEARGRPFPRSPRSLSRLNLHVLRPLTRGPQGQPSPPRTRHGRPGVQSIFSTSRGQAPHDWPMVHQSMATGSPIPGGCCSVFSAAPPTCDVPLSCASPRHPFLPNSRAPRRPIPLGLLCGPSLWPFSVLSPSPVLPCFYPTRRPQPCSAGPLHPHPSGDRFVRLARVDFFPLLLSPALVPSPFTAYSPRPAPSHAPGAVVRP